MDRIILSALLIQPTSMKRFLVAAIDRKLQALAQYDMAGLDGLCQSKRSDFPGARGTA
jgi:hypothetical protein